MTLLKPLPRAVTRPISFLILLAWVVVMGLLVQRSYLTASTSLATDLARYGSTASWRGLYYRGEKIGFTVSQTVPRGDGFELQEDGRLQMTLLGAASVTTLKTVARVDRAFALQSFEFSLDPGTGAIRINGRVEGAPGQKPRLALAIQTKGGGRTETRELEEIPILSLNLSRLLANGRLTAGSTHRLALFDPATLRNAPVVIQVGDREIVRGAERPVPAFRVDMAFQGMRTTSWVTDTGVVVREESPLGLISVEEPAARAQQLAVSGRMQSDLLNASAVVPAMTQRIEQPRDVRRLQLTLSGVDLAGFDLNGVGQTFAEGVLDIRDPRDLRADTSDPLAEQYLAAEPFLESDDPDIRAEAELAVRGAGADPRARAERLTRHVNALLEKKPTVSLPSAREVLRTRVGDCNEHTALYVAMARSIGIPARIDVGLVFMHGAFYYHAWPEVYLDEANGRGYWLPVDPTLNEFPADATHVRFVRGGLDKQAAIIPLIGRLKMAVTRLELAPNSVPILIGQQSGDFASLPVIPASKPSRCNCSSGERAAR
jgi:transglutaminase-like putative cysteine protease